MRDLLAVLFVVSFLFVVLLSIIYCQYKKMGKVYFTGLKDAVPVFVCGVLFTGIVAVYFNEIVRFVENAIKS